MLIRRKLIDRCSGANFAFLLHRHAVGDPNGASESMVGKVMACVIIVIKELLFNEIASHQSIIASHFDSHESFSLIAGKVNSRYF